MLHRQALHPRLRPIYRLLFVVVACLVATPVVGIALDEIWPRNTVVFDDVIVNNTTTLKGSFTLTGDITTTDTGTQNNYNPTGLATASVLRLNPASALTITGIAGGADGRILIIENVSSGANVTLSNASGSSSAANQILGYGGVGLTLTFTASNGNSAAILEYDGTISKWRTLSITTTTLAQTFTFSGGASVAGLTVSSGNLTLSTPTGHISVVGGTSPGLTSCGGGTPSITGSDVAGRVVEGTTATGCIITFAATYTNAPSCTVTSETQLAAFSYVVSATAITISNTSSSGDVIHYHCDKAS